MIIWISFIIVISTITYLIVEQVRQFVLSWQILDIPNHRSSHTTPTPHGGGIVISFGTLLGVTLYTVLFNPIQLIPLGSFILAGTLITTIGCFDDVRGLSTPVRFGSQLLASASIITGLGYWESISILHLFEIDLGLWGIPITILWLIGLTNAYNFMDGIDGLAGSQAIITGTAWAYIGWQYNESTLLVWSTLIIATTLGFLLHNWHPAKIFMGDVGSTFLGLTFATIPLFVQFSANEGTISLAFPSLLLGIVFIWLFLFDTSFTFINRLIRKEHVLTPHRSHLYQLLNRAGTSQHHVTFLFIILGIIPILLLLFPIGSEFSRFAISSSIIIILSLVLLIFTKQKMLSVDD